MLSRISTEPVSASTNEANAAGEASLSISEVSHAGRTPLVGVGTATSRARAGCVSELAS